MGDIRAKLDNALEEVYPDRVTPGLPRALPIEQYTGTYFHPAYVNITLELATDATRAGKPEIELVANRNLTSWKDFCSFEHVSGEHWMMYSDSAASPSSFMKEYAPAQFTIGSNGKVKSLGIEWRDLVGNVDGLIWFDKII